METTVNNQVQAGRSHQSISWLLIYAMLLLRIVILGVIGIFARPDWLSTFYQVGTYFLTALFLWWEIKNLKEYHIDTLALLIIIVFKPVQTLLLWLRNYNIDLTFPNFAAILIWIIALGLGLACWSRRKDLPRFEWKSLGFFGIGTLAGIFMTVLLAVPMSFQAEFIMPPSVFWDTLKQQGLWSFAYQIAYAGVAEEPLFRAFLWEALRKSGWRDVWIWLFQAGLFALAHIYYLKQAPISFFVIVPVGALIMGWVAWKTRSISTSLAAHGAANSLGMMMGELAKYFLH